MKCAVILLNGRGLTKAEAEDLFRSHDNSLGRLAAWGAHGSSFRGCLEQKFDEIVREMNLIEQALGLKT